MERPGRDEELDDRLAETDDGGPPERDVLYAVARPSPMAEYLERLRVPAL